MLLDANWRWDNVAQQTTLLVGDAISNPGWWGHALRFGGVQFGSNFALQPGFVTYPLMAASGLATVPSTADILINNVRVAEQQVPAGPFTISNLPTMTGAGQLNMVVRDAFGQQQVVSQPFYIAQQLLKPGLTEYSVGAGAARLNYGLENFDYGGSFGYGWIRQGFTSNLTGELRAEADTDGAAAGVGADVLIGDIGVVSGGIAGSSGPNGSGTRYLIGFDRQTPFLSFGARYTSASKHYREIGDIGPQISEWSTAFLRMSFGRYGSTAFGYTGQRYFDDDPLTIYSASYSVNVGARAFLTLTGAKILGRQNQTQALVLLTVPLGVLTSATASVQSIRQAGETTTIGEAVVQRSLPVGEGYGYYLRANTEQVAAGGVSYAGAYGRYTLEAATDHGRSARARQRRRRHCLGRRHDDVRAADRAELRRRQGRRTRRRARAAVEPGCRADEGWPARSRAGAATQRCDGLDRSAFGADGRRTRNNIEDRRDTAAHWSRGRVSCRA